MLEPLLGIDQRDPTVDLCKPDGAKCVTSKSYYYKFFLCIL